MYTCACVLLLADVLFLCFVIGCDCQLIIKENYDDDDDDVCLLVSVPLLLCNLHCILKTFRLNGLLHCCINCRQCLCAVCVGGMLSLTQSIYV